MKRLAGSAGSRAIHFTSELLREACAYFSNHTLANMVANGPEEIMNDSNNTLNGTSVSGSQNVASGGTRKTGVIVGVVVGIGGALILGGLAFWLFRRHKAKKRKEEEGRRAVAPYVVSEKELYRAASWSSVNARGSVTAANPREPRRRGSDDERPPRRILREQDAEEDFEVLPPLYREWQPRLGPDDEAAASLPAPPRPHPNTPNGAATAIPPVEPSSSLKDDYIRALSLLPGSTSGQASGSSTQPPIAPLKEEYARTFGLDGSTQPAPVAAVASNRHPEDTQEIVHTESPSSHEQPHDKATHHAECRPNRPPSARLSIGSIEEGGDLKEDYKRTFL